MRISWKRRPQAARWLAGLALSAGLWFGIDQIRAGAPDDGARLERQFGLQLLSHDLQRDIAPEVDTPTRPVALTDLPDADRPAAIATLASALASYPPAFIHRMLHRVAMAGDIMVFGKPVGGFFHGDMVAISYFNVQDKASATFDADTLHHELSSIVRKHVSFNVTVWDNANPPGFTYMDEAAYQQALVQPGSVDGDDTLHQAGFVAAYGQTSLDNDWNTYAEKIFGHGAAFAREIAPYPAMRTKTRLLIDIYQGLDPGFAPYFERTGLRAAVER